MPSPTWMHHWHGRLNGDPLPWLLDEAEPAVRHRALRELLGRSADDPDVADARTTAMASDPIAGILAAQDPEGWWVKPGGGYSPSTRARCGRSSSSTSSGRTATTRASMPAANTCSHMRKPRTEASASRTRSAVRPRLTCTSPTSCRSWRPWPRREPPPIHGWRMTIDWLLEQQDAQGRWRNQYRFSGKKLVDIDRSRGPSRWVTLRAGRVLKMVAEASRIAT